MKKLDYSSEFASEVMTTIPYGYIDKTVCGCGLSTVALENSEHTILAVPSVSLIQNKVVQYPNCRFEGRILGVYGDISAQEITNYVQNAKVIKIMVTYDSLWKVEHLLGFCRLIIDESNRLLSNKKLKATSKKTGVDVIKNLFTVAEKYKETVSFISATPIPLDYLPKWISNIEQVKITWDGTIKAQPILMQRTYPYKSLSEEIIKPMITNGFVNIANNKISKAIVFVNSISAIQKTLKDCQISSDDVRFVVGDTVANDVALKGYKRLENPNQLTKFTFVTGTGFDGIDLNDPEAISIVVSNTDKNYHLIDITTDLKQAISRQRNKKNPNYGKYVFLYNQTVFESSEQEMLAMLDEKRTNLEQAIWMWEAAKNENKRGGFIYTKDNPDFIAYTNFDVNTETYTIDEDTFQADRYFILEVRRSFEKGFDIKGIIEAEDSNILAPIALPKSVSYEQLVEYFEANLNAEKGTIDWGLYSTKVDWIQIIETTYRMYGKVWSHITTAKEMISNYIDPKSQIKTLIQAKFSTGKRYTRKYIKQVLSEVYTEQGLTRVPKHTDMFEYFEVKEVKVQGEHYQEINKKLK